MIMQRNYWKKMPLAMLLAAATACSTDEGTPARPNTGTGENFVLATSVQDGDKTANVLLTAARLDEGSVSAVGNGLVNDGATEWVFYKEKYSPGAIRAAKRAW